MYGEFIAWWNSDGDCEVISERIYGMAEVYEI
jgi:hypothetical protein